MDILKIIGKNIAYLRRKLGLSQEEMAYRAHIDRSYLSQIEHGKRNITLIMLIEIAQVLDVEPTTLMKEKIDCCKVLGARFAAAHGVCTHVH